MARRLMRFAGAIATGAAAVAGLAGCAGKIPEAKPAPDRIVATSSATPRVAAATSTPPSKPRYSSPRYSEPPYSGALAHRGLLVVGASYTQGLGARPQTEGYAYQLGRMLGWRTQVDGISGTGFVNPGPRRHGKIGGTFAQRIARLQLGFDPGIVLIQGGRNDAGAPAQQLYTAVRHTVAVTRTRFAGADIAFLGPIPGAFPVGRAQQTVEQVLARAAQADGVLFIDPLAEHWISPANLPQFRGPVPRHPNNAGYSYIAERLVTDLQAWEHGKSA